jgi:hypothetical protein
MLRGNEAMAINIPDIARAQLIGKYKNLKNADTF